MDGIYVSQAPSAMNSSGAVVIAGTTVAQFANGYLDLQSGGATTGNVRLPAGGSVVAYDSGNVFLIGEGSGTGRVLVGSPGAAQSNILLQSPSGLGIQGYLSIWDFQNFSGSVEFWKATGTTNSFGASMQGYAANSIPFSLSIATVTPGSDASIVLTAAQYICPIIELATGSWTTGHTVTFPANTGGFWLFNNKSSQTATLTATSGSISVTTGKHVFVYCDGSGALQQMTATN